MISDFEKSKFLKRYYAIRSIFIRDRSIFGLQYLRRTNNCVSVIHFCATAQIQKCAGVSFCDLVASSVVDFNCESGRIMDRQSKCSRHLRSLAINKRSRPDVLMISGGESNDTDDDEMNVDSDVAPMADCYDDKQIAPLRSC